MRLRVSANEAIVCSMSSRRDLLPRLSLTAILGGLLVLRPARR